MLITAHGGAHGTGRNSKLYFSRIPEYECDVLEVDVRKRGNTLYIAHLPALFPKRHLSLEYALEKAKEYGKLINCDMNERGLVGDVIELAKKTGTEDKILFTGWVVSEKEAENLPFGRVFFNKLSGIPFKEGNAAKIKERLGDNPRLAGINAGKRFVSDKFLAECAEAGIAVSLYTLSSRADAERYVKLGLYNLTCNNPAEVREVFRGYKEQ